MKKPLSKKTFSQRLFIVFTIVFGATLIGVSSVYALTLLSPTSLTYQAPLTHTTLQSFTADDCATMATYTTLKLTDTRNNKAYRIRKMPDGHCWMIDNLALSTATHISANDTDIDTDAGSDFIAKWNSLNTNGAPVQNTATHKNGVCTAASSATIANGEGKLTCDGANYADANDGYVAYSDPSLPTNEYYENCTEGNGTNPDSLTGCGYLYNWYTSTAGSGTYQKTSTNVKSSICPKGWQLPTGNSSGQFAVLSNAMATGATTPSTANNANTRKNWRANGPFSGSLAGSYYSSFGGAGSGGNYWSSSAFSNATYAYYLYFNYGYVNPGNSYDGRYYGRSVRCML